MRTVCAGSGTPALCSNVPRKTTVQPYCSIRESISSAGKICQFYFYFEETQFGADAVLASDVIYHVNTLAYHFNLRFVNNNSEVIICLFAGVFEQLRTAAKLLGFPYKEGVAGLNPAIAHY